MIMCAIVCKNLHSVTERLNLKKISPRDRMTKIQLFACIETITCSSSSVLSRLLSILEALNPIVIARESKSPHDITILKHPKTNQRQLDIPSHIYIYIYIYGDYYNQLANISTANLTELKQLTCIFVRTSYSQLCLAISTISTNACYKTNLCNLSSTIISV